MYEKTEHCVSNSLTAEKAELIVEGLLCDFNPEQQKEILILCHNRIDDYYRNIINEKEQMLKQAQENLQIFLNN
jgi:O-methyltransferase involved in polyketide biosynthesis